MKISTELPTSQIQTVYEDMMQTMGSIPAMQTLGNIMRVTGMAINDPRLTTLTRNQAELMFWIDLVSDPKKLKAYKAQRDKTVDEDFETEFEKANSDDWEKV